MVSVRFARMRTFPFMVAFARSCGAVLQAKEQYVRRIQFARSMHDTLTSDFSEAAGLENSGL